MKDIITKFAAANYNGINGMNNVVESGAGDDLPGIIIGILNGVISVLAVVCVVVIVMGGGQYMMSSGDAAKVKKAKDTILYALIGLIICALAAAIVNFVIKQVIG